MVKSARIIKVVMAVLILASPLFAQRWIFSKSTKSSGGGGPTIIATDNFNRADGGLGSNWTSLYIGGSNVMGIASNQIQSSGSSVGIEYSFWSANAFTTNQYSKVRCATTYNWDKVGVICRASSGNYYYAYAYYTGGGAAEFGKVVSGTKTIFSNAITSTLTTTSVIQIKAIGTTISWYIDGVLKESTTDASLSSGAAGIAIDNTSGAGMVDDWEGGNL